MNALGEAYDTIEDRRKTLEVYANDDAVGSELETQFSTRNIRVTRHAVPPTGNSGFVIIRSRDGEFRGALSIDLFRTILSPEIHPPWDLSETETDYAVVFDFLDNTVFASYDRRQMLATAREIEERAWRVNAGTLYVGFQNSAAFADQAPVYDRFARERSVEIRIFIEDESDVEVDESIDVISESADEIGQFWLVAFDGGGSDMNKCGLLAEERDPGHYYGFWTYDPEIVDAIVSYLRSTYGSQ